MEKRESMQVLVIVVTYNPDLELLKKNIDAYKHSVDKILIWRNSLFDKEQFFQEYENIEFVGNSENQGISVALNYAWNYAKQNGYKYLLTMDQDSVFESFEEFKNACFSKLTNELCVVGPLVNSSKNTEPAFICQNTLITSGSFIPVELLDIVNGYERSFFVDGIDIDFSYNVKSHGFNIYSYAGAVLHQTFGVPIKKKVLWKEFIVFNYNPFRLYGYFRNILIVYRKYNRPLDLLKMYLGALRNTIFNILFYESSKFIKLKSIFKGIKDGLVFEI